MSGARIALATYARHPGATDDDALLVAALRASGADPVALPWDAAHARWEHYDAVVLRSTWDYHLRHDEFLRWIGSLADSGVPLWNPASLVRWNSDKRYLHQLAGRGVAVVPTAWSDDEGERTLRDIARDREWTEPLVVKPAVSASAHGTWRMAGPPTEADEHRYAEARRRGSVMVQPLVREVEANGEWSLVFIGGAFSHAVIKRPADGDFRVQAEHGGSARAAAPPPALVADARRALEAGIACAGVGATSVLYARVDGVARDGRLLLMELECIEPSLFLLTDGGAAARLAAALLERVPGSPVTEAHGRASRQGNASARR